MNASNPGNYIFLPVKVIPNASKNAVDGWEGANLKVRIHGVPEKGKANKKLIEYLADQLGISKARISIRSGETSRIKRIRIDGLSLEEVRKKWP